MAEDRQAGARYVQIADWLRAQCAALGPGSALPTEVEVAERFAVSRMTARHAFQELAQAGLVERRRGAGSFVLAPPLHREESVLRSFTQDMRLRGLVPSSRVLRAEVEVAPDAAARLGLAPSDWVVTIERVRYADGVAVALERASLPGEFAPVLEADLESGSLHRALSELGRRLGRATGHVTARLATPEEARVLGLSVPSALLVESRLISDTSGRLVESTQSAYVGSRWAIDIGAFVAPPASEVV